MHKENAELLKALAECAEECDHCASACLQESDVKMLARCIALDYDCAAVCHQTMSFVSRGSESAAQMVKLCADVCRMCAEECEKHSKMEHCKDCAEACRRCEEACRSYAAA